MILNAYNILTDASRPSAMLAESTPATPETCPRPDVFAFFGVIKDFHVTWENLDTRFYSDYASACRALRRALTQLDEILPNTCLVDSKCAGGRVLQVMDRTWEAVMLPDRPYTVHHLWYDLHNLRVELSGAREPNLQQAFLADLPVNIQASIVDLLCPKDARSMAAASKLYRDLCTDCLNKNGKVSLWYNHAYIGRNALAAAAQEISAPMSLFGRGVACLWAWFRDRNRTGRALMTTSMTIDNKWGWARTVYSEFRWLSMPNELRAWATCFWGGILSLKFLCDLRIDAMALTFDCLEAVAQHGALVSLDLRACGIVPHAAGLPVLPRLRRLTLIWDPASAFETGAAAELVPLAKNVVYLRLESRVRGGPIPLAFHPSWPAPKLRRLQRLVLSGVAATFARALLSACRSTSLERFAVHFRYPPAIRTVRGILLYAAACSSAFDELVIDGLARPDRRLLRDVTTYFPVLRSLAILPRQHNQVNVTAFCWNSTVWGVGQALHPLGHLQRLCTNLPVCADAVGPKYLDRAETGTTRAENAAEQDGAEMPLSDDSLDEDEAAVLALAFHCPALTEVVFAGRNDAYVSQVQRYAERGAEKEVIRLASSSLDRPWWKV